MKEILDEISRDLPMFLSPAEVEDKTSYYENTFIHINSLDDAKVGYFRLFDDYKKILTNVIQLQGVVERLQGFFLDTDDMQRHFQEEIQKHEADCRHKDDELKTLQLQFDTFKEAIALMNGTNVNSVDKEVPTMSENVNEKDDVDTPYIVYLKATPYEGENWARWVRFKTFFNRSRAFAFVNDYLDKHDGKGKDWGGEIKIMYDNKDVFNGSWGRF